MVVIKKNKSGYHFRARFGKDENGNPIQLRGSGFKTKKEAETYYFQLCQEVENQRKKGTLDKSYLMRKKTDSEDAQEKNDRKQQVKRQELIENPQGVLIKDHLQKWFETVYVTQVAETTAYNRWTSIKKHIFPYFGHMPVKDMKTLMLDEFYRAKLKEGLSPKSVREFHSLLKNAFAKAKTWGLTESNPVLGATPPVAKTVKKSKPWTNEEAKHFLEVVEREGEECFYITAIFTGMRKGELLGLKWTDIDLDKGKIHITRSLTRIKGKGLVLTSVKTENSNRQISISPYVVQTLQEHYQKQQRLITESSGVYDNKGFVFTSETGNLKDPRNVLREYSDFIKKAKVRKITIHDLRHLHATLLLENGENPKVVQERLGHNDVETTLNIYSHVQPDIQEAAANRLEESFFA